jgi:hypothetical protein
MKILKLMALDKEDLSIVSAYMQDAVLKIADLDFRAGENRFFLAANRFVWEEADGKRRKSYERRRSALHFNRVTAVRSRGFSRRDGDQVLSLLTVNFVPGPEAPGGTIELVFSADVSIELSVECIEAQLSDLGAAWETEFRPTHPLSDV